MPTPILPAQNEQAQTQETNTNQHTPSNESSNDESNKKLFHIKKVARQNKVSTKSKGIVSHRKIITKCVHTDAEYYANGMCFNCYHSHGRKKKAFKCRHPERVLYAKGQCKSCYLMSYAKGKKQPSDLDFVNSLPFSFEL